MLAEAPTAKARKAKAGAKAPAQPKAPKASKKSAGDQPAKDISKKFIEADRKTDELVKKVSKPKKARVVDQKHEEQLPQAMPAVTVPDDLEAFAGMTEPSTDQLSQISMFSRRWSENEQKLQGLEELMKQINAEQHQLVTKEIPDAMAAAGVESITDKDGNKVEIKEFLNGTLPKDPFKRKLAIDFITDEGGSAIIKRQIVLQFDKGDKDRADKAAHLLKKAGYELVDRDDIHTQTYLAFIRDLLRDGKKVPLEDLGLFAGRAAKIKPPKKKLPKFGIEAL